MRQVRILIYALIILVCIWGIGTRAARAQVKSQDARVALVDNCDPTTFMGLCVVLPRPGDTTFTEFLALLFYPLSTTVVGHPAWRFELEVEQADPQHIEITSGTDGVVPFERLGVVTVPGVGTLCARVPDGSSASVSPSGSCGGSMVKASAVPPATPGRGR